MGASVRARLLTIARERNQLFHFVLTRFVLERLLYRLTLTSYRDRFALKGAMLTATWFADPHRPTREIDLLGFGDSDGGAMITVFREVCAVAENDGVIFDTNALRVELVRDDLEYGGLRLRTEAQVDGARVPVTIDIGFGDATEPGLEEFELPVLLDFAAPRLRSYARETVIAEKFEAIVKLGRANTRLKDFYDIWVMSRSYEFDDDRLARALLATFSRRRTLLPAEPPDGLTAAFANDPAKRRQWTAFLADVSVQPGDLKTVIGDLATFLIPHATRAAASAQADSAT
jgi:hypothetical protein